jgi:small basic protein
MKLDINDHRSKDLSIIMQSFPYVTDYINEIFDKEKARFDYKFIRPIFTISFFFLRIVLVPLKFLFHRSAWGFEKRLIDGILAFGIKYFASYDALELLIRHVQIEPLLYRYLLSGTPERRAGSGEMLKGIDGDFSVNSIQDIVAHGLTICHDDLSYEIFERFDKRAFLDNLAFYRNSRPEDIAQFGNKVLEQNRKHSWQIFGATNVVVIVVITITIFANFHTSIRALNSFDSDSLLLWCLKNICAEDRQAMIDLDFYIPTDSNRSHYNSDAFRSDPNQYLYYHIALDEFAYELLRKNQQAL